MNQTRLSRGPFSRFTSPQMISGGFLLFILFGSFLLMLPVSTADGRGAEFADALFTATSALCVTGLVVQDTATYWSSFGHVILLILIQIGGLGVVTLASMLAVLAGKKIGLLQRTALQDSFSVPTVGGIIRLILFAVKVTLLTEFLGFLLLIPSFTKSFDLSTGIWYALFHSVSAFCNAGFDLMGKNAPFSSLTAFADDPVVTLVICTLIIVGGMGFATWWDIFSKRLKIHRYQMQSKVVLTMTITLILIPTAYFFFVTFRNEQGLTRFLLSAFQAVTPRTAGFNTADLTSLGEMDLTLMIFLMLIGGSPGSTAGGMKTTTIAVLAATCLSVFRQDDETTLYKRFISVKTIKTAITILLLYLVLFFTAGTLIHYAEGLPLLTCLFESASALGTVGLTLGITPSLGHFSRFLLILLMYLGRVGGLTLIATAVSVKSNSAHYPMEHITVG